MPNDFTSRPGRGGPPNDPMPSLVLRAPEAAPQRRWTARDLAVRLFYRFRLFLGCLILGIIAGLALAVVTKTVFTAETVLIVLLGPDSVLIQDSLDLNNTPISIDGLKAVQSEIQIIQSDIVMRAAVQDVGLDKLYPNLTHRRLFGLRAPMDPARQMGAALERFHSDLRVDAQGASNVIRVSFSHTDRALAIATVQAVTKAYLAQRRAIYANDNATLLGQEIRRYSAHLLDIENEIQAVRRKYDVLDTAQDIVLATNRLDGIVQRQNQVKERRVAVQTEQVAVRANLAKQPATVLDFRETTNNTGNDEARNTLVRLLQERVHLSTQFKPDWPAFAELDNKIAVLRGQISKNAQSLYFTERTIQNPAINVLNNRLASLDVENQALAQQLVELDEQSAAAAERIKALREAEGILHTLILNRDVAEAIYKQLSLRQPTAILNDDTFVEKNAAVRVAQPPSAPLDGRNLGLTFAIGGVFFGLFLGLTAVAVATMLQQIYILPTDAERDLSLPHLGDVDNARVPGQPQPARRGYGIVASALLGLSIDDRPLSMVQVVAPSGPKNDADVALALGTEFARGFAMRTLILDLRPAGAPALLPVSATAPELGPGIPIAATAQDDLWISVDARKALFGERGQMLTRAWQTISGLRHRFEMVLVVTPADLAEPTMHRVASIVDANIIVLHAETTRRAIASRFREMILEAGGNMAGFLFVGRKYYVPQWLYRRL